VLNLPMVRRGVRRLLAGAPADIRAFAVEETVLCGEETATSSPAVFLDGALDKITGLSPWRSWELESGAIHGGKGTHGRSFSYVLENVDLVGAFLYRGAAKMQPGYGKPSLLTRDMGERRVLERANLVTSNSGSHFFGTLLLDDFPLGLISEGNAANISMVSRPFEHEAGYRSLLDLPLAPLARNAHIKRLTMYVDFAQNSYKAARYRKLRARLRARLGAQASSPRGVYIKRGATGEPRVLENEAAIVRLLADEGFDVIDPGAASAEEIAWRSLDAGIVVGVEGSHLSHAIFSAADGCTFLVIQPPDRFAMAYKEFTDRLDMTFAFLVGDRSQHGFSVPPDDVRRMLDVLDARPAAVSRP
jgi:hypothetical protein